MITSPAFAGKRYAVLGLARSGAATVAALVASGARVTAWDADEAKRDALILPIADGEGDHAQHGGRVSALADHPSTAFGGPPPQAVLGEDLVLADPLEIDLAGFDGVVVSPGVPLNRHPIAAHAKAAGVPIIGDIELFAQARASLPPHKVVGITGTNGKSTTTALIHHILQTTGVPTTMGGNIGLPILAQAPLTPNANGVGVYVLELSSYQLDLTFSLDCDVAVLTNITPDHLDRYDGFEAYAASKARLFYDMQTSRHLSILIEDGGAVSQIAAELDEYREWGMLETNPFKALFKAERQTGSQAEWPALQGPHNFQNVAAVFGTCRYLGVSKRKIGEALRTYPGLPHRMERVGERAGVLYVNDSKATNATATAPALAAYPVIHWILGGLPKSDDLDDCAPHFDHVRAGYTIGEAGPMFANILRKAGLAVTESGTLARAVRDAAVAARAGEVVMLSPACASFDQFRDYEARGQAFRDAVAAL